MKANEINFLKFLEPRNQFFVPIFQRRYSWKKKHCNQLWDDVLRIGQNDEILSYFLGSIVYMKDGDAPIGTVSRFLVIDGQQRLATLSLLISALGEAIHEHCSKIGITQDQLSNFYLFNNMADGELHHKLLLTRSDKNTLIQLLNGRIDCNEPPADASVRLLENYQFFKAQLNPDNLGAVYAGIQKLMIVGIILESPGDNPQLIFDSLNSTGLELSEADRIRNYVLMGQSTDFQNNLYENYWSPIEDRFGNQYANWFDLFIRDYLTLKTRQIPNIDSVYDKFKAYIPNTTNSEKLGEIIADIDHYSKHYVKFALLHENDSDFRECFEDINELEAGVARPFLLEVYEDYTQGKIEKMEVIEILRLVESYVFRRAISDVPTNSLNKTFASLMRGLDKDKYLENLKTVFLRLTDNRRYPLDTEFKEKFILKDVYNFKRRNYLLRKLENHRRRELISVADYTIEHVMPQNPDLSESWQQELGENWQEIQEKYLHTIGNLTLTGYNPELSDRSFSEKKEHKPGGFRDSRLRLNDSLLREPEWNEDAILARAEELAEKALKIWISPQ
jgi:uncharacterized protein with ParB-like and HNH nuclease domain